MGDLVVLNATPLTNFALVGRPDLPLRLWQDKICTTSAVMEEYQAGVLSGRLPANVWQDLPVAQLSEGEEIWMAELSLRLGNGERSCIAVAFHRSGLLVTDDLDARRLARELGVRITGSIGILVACVRAGLVNLDGANALLDMMITAGFRSPVRLLDDLV